MKTLRDAGEDEVIRLIASMATKRAGSSIIKGIGDDTAVLDLGNGRSTLFTIDTMVEGVHFQKGTDAFSLGYKAMTSNISDVAAMGGTPAFAVVSAALPAGMSVDDVAAMYTGVETAAERYGVSVVGGDTTSSETTVLTVALLGEAAPDLVRGRDMAKSGDIIFVTGELGGSAAGLGVIERGLDRNEYAACVARHERPEARVAAGSAAAGAGANAMEDVSDGLAAEIAHICEASGTGARIDARSIPLMQCAIDVAGRLGKEPLDLALFGGEDYELVITAPPENAEAVKISVKRTGVRITEVGTITEGSACILVDSKGAEAPIAGRGYSHFRENR